MVYYVDVAPVDSRSMFTVPCLPLQTFTLTPQQDRRQQGPTHHPARPQRYRHVRGARLPSTLPPEEQTPGPGPHCHVYQLHLPLHSQEETEKQ